MLRMTPNGTGNVPHPGVILSWWASTQLQSAKTLFRLQSASFGRSWFGPRTVTPWIVIRSRGVMLTVLHPRSIVFPTTVNADVHNQGRGGSLKPEFCFLSLRSAPRGRLLTADLR